MFFFFVFNFIFICFPSPLNLNFPHCLSFVSQIGTTYSLKSINFCLIWSPSFPRVSYFHSIDSFKYKTNIYYFPFIYLVVWVFEFRLDDKPIIQNEKNTHIKHNHDMINSFIIQWNHSSTKHKTIKAIHNSQLYIHTNIPTPTPNKTQRYFSQYILEIWKQNNNNYLCLWMHREQ